jgi:hypothetical protein
VQQILGQLFDKVVLEEPKFCYDIELDPDLLVEGHEVTLSTESKSLLFTSV